MKAKTERCTKGKRLCVNLDPQCDARHEKTGFYCTRPWGHPKNTDHVACYPAGTRAEDHNLATWPQAENVKPDDTNEADFLASLRTIIGAVVKIRIPPARMSWLLRAEAERIEKGK